jgi:hypothetical protein
MFQQATTLLMTVGQPGDLYGQRMYQAFASSVADITGITIGTFVWKKLNTDNYINQAKGTNTVLAGLVSRDNTNTNPLQGLSTNASYVIGYGQIAPVETRGRFYVALKTIVGTNPVLQGSPVYIDNVTGEIVADGGGVLTTYTKTNFVFESVSSALVANATVVISNVNDAVGV